MLQRLESRQQVVSMTPRIPDSESVAGLDNHQTIWIEKCRRWKIYVMQSSKMLRAMGFVWILINIVDDYCCTACIFNLSDRFTIVEKRSFMVINGRRPIEALWFVAHPSKRGSEVMRCYFPWCWSVTEAEGLSADTLEPLQYTAEAQRVRCR